MQKTRQQILFLCLSRAELDSKTVAWALYDGAQPRGETQMQTGDSAEPPYESVLHAMCDGWKVLQVPTLPYFVHGHENELGHLPFEYVMQREVVIHE